MNYKGFAQQLQKKKPKIWRPNFVEPKKVISGPILMLFFFTIIKSGMENRILKSELTFDLFQLGPVHVFRKRVK